MVAREAEMAGAVRTGERFGFLGPSGAGKTTTLGILAGVCRADEGRVTVLEQVQLFSRLYGYRPD